MAKSKTSFKAGASGNPNGRPPKSRALTDILLAVGKVKCSDGNGGQIERKKLLAEMVWQLAVAGEVTFHAGNRAWGASRTFELPAAQWFEVVRWMFDQIDGQLSIVINASDEKPNDAKDAAAAGNAKPLIYMPDNGRGDRVKDAQPDE